MTRQHRSIDNISSIGGGVLIGLGLHILSSNVERAAGQLSHILCTPAEASLGPLPSAVMAAAQVRRQVVVVAA